MELSRVYLEIIDPAHTQHTKMLEAQFMAFMQLHSKHYFMTPCTKSDSFLISLRNQGHCLVAVRCKSDVISSDVVSNRIHMQYQFQDGSNFLTQQYLIIRHSVHNWLQFQCHCRIHDLLFIGQGQTQGRFPLAQMYTPYTVSNDHISWESDMICPRYLVEGLGNQLPMSIMPSREWEHPIWGSPISQKSEVFPR